MKKITTIAQKPIHFFKKLSFKKKAFLVTLIIIAIIAAGQIANANKPVEYNTAKVTRGSITEIVSEPGVITASGKINVTSPATGIIETMYVENGQSVTEGQELFKVKSTATEAERAAAYASYQQAVSALKTAEQSKLTLDAQMWAAHQSLLTAQNTVNYKDDNETNPTTGEDYTELEKESIESGLVQAEKNFNALEKKVVESDVAITAAQAQVNSTLLSYQATQNAIVKAQTNGTVANLSATRGDSVAAGAASSALASGQSSALSSLGGQSATPILSLVSDSTINVTVPIGQSDIAKVRTGQEAIIEPEAYSDKLYHGRVIRTDSIGTDIQGVVIYNVYVSILDADEQLRAGMTTDTDIITQERDNILLVPNAAVKPYQGKRAVRIVDPETNELKYLPVETGIRGTTNTEIINGLEEGQEIVTSLTNEQIERSGPF